MAEGQLSPDPGLDRERHRKALYVALAQAPEWPRVLHDLLQFAASTPDPRVRCGREDLVLYMVESSLALPEG